MKYASSVDACQPFARRQPPQAKNIFSPSCKRCVKAKYLCLLLMPASDEVHCLVNDPMFSKFVRADTAGRISEKTSSVSGHLFHHDEIEKQELQVFGEISCKCGVERHFSGSLCLSNSVHSHSNSKGLFELDFSDITSTFHCSAQITFN